MAGSRTVDVALNARDNMTPAFEKAAGGAKTLGDSLNTLAKGTTSAGFQSLTQYVRQFDSEIRTVGQALTGFGVGITAAIGVSVNQFAGLEAAMANVGTIAGQSDAWLASMTEQIKALAVELGASPTGLAEGLYDLIGSGVAANDALGVLRTSAIAAKAGLTDTGVAARAITAVLNAYGKSAREAGNISDVLFKVVDSGVISFEELANSLGRALPLANTLQVSVEELGAAYAELTRQGLNASEAETSFTALLTAALNPTEELKDAVRAYGYESAEAMIKTEGFTAFLQFLDAAAAGSSSRMQELTGNVRANNAALILAQDEAAGYTDRLLEMDAAAQDGIYTQQVFDQQMSTVAGSASRLRASLSVLAVTVGEAFAPFARAGIDAATAGVNALSSAIDSLPGPLQAVTAGLVGVAGGVGVLAGGFLLLLPRIVETRVALQTLGGVRGVIGLLTSAFNPLTLAMTGVAGIGVLIYENMRRGSEAARNYAQSVTMLADAVEQLRIVGDDTRANFLEGAQQRVDELVSTLDEADEGALTFFETLNLGAQGIDPTQYSLALADDFNRAIAMADEVNARIADAFSNPNIDASAYNAFITGLFDTIAVTAEGSNIDEVFDQILTTPLSDFRQEASDAMSVLEAGASGASTAFGALTARIGEGQDMLAALADRADDFATTLDDIRLEGDIALAAQLEELDARFRENADSSERYLDAQDRIFDAARDGSVNVAAVGSVIADLNEQLDAGVISQEEYEAHIVALSQSLADYTAGSRNAIDRTRELTQEFTAAAFAVAGWDTALSQLNLTGLTGELGLFAAEGDRAFTALDNTFRIIVGNTNALKQQVEGVQSWADSLINVRGELGRIDDLLAGDFIDKPTYDAAQDAYDRVAASVLRIGNNIDTVQAIQAPFIADAIAGTVAWTDELRAMDAATQRTALAFADLQTVQQAQELITLGNSEAFRAMGEDGRFAFEQTIQGALQANPLLFNVLETMGIISGTPIDFDVNFDRLTEAGSALDQLVTQIGYLVDTLREIYRLPPLSIDVDTGSVADAARTVDFLYERVAQADGQEAYLIVRVDETGAQTIDRIVDSVDNLDGTYTVTVEAQTGETYEAVLAQDGTVISTTYVDVVPRLSAAGAGGMTAGALTDIAGQLGIPETIDTIVTIITQGGETVQPVADAIASLPETATVTVGVDVTGWETVGSLYDTLRDLETARTVTVTVDADTSGIDNALIAYGIGDGGGGGAARWEAPRVTVTVDADTSAIDDWTPPDDLTATVTLALDTGGEGGFAQALGQALYGPRADGYTATVRVEADTSAADAALATLADTAGGVPDTVSISAIALTEGATAALNGVTDAAEGIPDNESVTVIAPGAATSAALLDDVTAAANGIPESETVGVNVSGWASAVAQLNAVADAAYSIPSSRTTSVTTYRDTVYRSFGSPVGAIQHGGIPHYATGGVLFRAGEGNRPEVAHFAAGGMALIPRDGLYVAPPMTYISPHNSATSYGGDVNVTVLVQGDVTSEDRLLTRFIDGASEAVAMAIRDERRASGDMS